jgi:hypothetical protein
MTVMIDANLSWSVAGSNPVRGCYRVTPSGLSIQHVSRSVYTMGSMQAYEMALQAEAVGLEHVVTWHLRSNHFPPVPYMMIPVALAAIEYGREDDYDTHIKLPEGTTFRGSDSATVGEIVEALHLDAFICPIEDEEGIEFEED